MTEYEAECLTCDWTQVMPKREMAEHAKTVHEREFGHDVMVRTYD